jgi:hypothetical protein
MTPAFWLTLPAVFTLMLVVALVAAHRDGVLHEIWPYLVAIWALCTLISGLSILTALIPKL